MRSHLSAGQSTCQWQANKKKTLLAIVVAALPSYCCCASVCCCCLVLLLLLLFSQQAFRLLLSAGSVRLWFLAAFVILSLTAGKSFCMYFWNAFKMFRPPPARITRPSPVGTTPCRARLCWFDAAFPHAQRPQRFVFVTNLTTIPTLTHTLSHTHTQRHF